MQVWKNSDLSVPRALATGALHDSQCRTCKWSTNASQSQRSGRGPAKRNEVERSESPPLCPRLATCYPVTATAQAGLPGSWRQIML